jgi:1-deoxy-D-xylulose-5-phosphate synthase
MRAEGLDTPTRELGIPAEFLAHGKVSDVRTAIGLTGQSIGRRIVEWAAGVASVDDPAGSSVDSSGDVSSGRSGPSEKT